MLLSWLQAATQKHFKSFFSWEEFKYFFLPPSFQPLRWGNLHFLDQMLPFFGLEVKFFFYLFFFSLTEPLICTGPCVWFVISRPKQSLTATVEPCTLFQVKIARSLGSISVAGVDSVSSTATFLSVSAVPRILTYVRVPEQVPKLWFSISGMTSSLELRDSTE